jgi:hypothetical protein
MSGDKGYTEKELLTKFGKRASYIGGGYTINFFNKELFETCTNKLFKKWKACFDKRGEKYYYGKS